MVTPFLWAFEERFEKIMEFYVSACLVRVYACCVYTSRWGFFCYLPIGFCVYDVAQFLVQFSKRLWDIEVAVDG